ncbi:MAG: hypothetical protein AAB907_00255 [Patescibacteria group bacterium]
MKILKPFIVELAPTLTGHWYKVWRAQEDGSKGEYLGVFVSSTTILTAYPQSEQLVKWIADHGFHESREIRDSAGREGINIHKACDWLEEGKKLYSENYSTKEWHKISTFVSWFKEYSPILITKEFSIFSETGRYAGTLDRIYNISNEITLLDFKSSSSVHPHFPLQFSSYAHAIEENTDLEIVQTAALQLGSKNKDGYRFVIYPDWRDHYKVFEHVKGTWEYDNKIDSDFEPPVLELPETLQL